jgi:acetolactate synthase-1/2/3 large subunit
LLADTLVGRIARGEGTAVLEQLFYPVDAKLAQMENVSDLILCGTERPVTFFAYPGKPSLPEPAGCTVASLCDPLMDIEWTLATLAAAVGASESSEFARVPYHVPTLPSGTLTLEKTGDALAALLPENAIIVNESVTAGSGLLPATATARSHDLLNTSGGAIGQALPCAVGAAAACPDRKVVVLTGDGSAMYTLQSLWTMAREKLDITIVVVGNRGYQILHDELVNVGAGSAGKNARRMFDIVEPELNWVLLAEGHGVAAARATDMESFNDAFAKGLAMDGPYLIEIVVPESD